MQGGPTSHTLCFYRNPKDFLVSGKQTNKNGKNIKAQKHPRAPRALIAAGNVSNPRRDVTRNKDRRRHGTAGRSARGPAVSQRLSEAATSRAKRRDKKIFTLNEKEKKQKTHT